jgi:uncharacterized protein (TIGR01777 family)
MKILISGATGFVGSHLVKRFLQSGHEVNVFTRDIAKAEKIFNHKSLKAFQWETYQNPPIEAFDGIHGIIHLMGENIGGKLWTSKQKKILYASRIDTSRAIHQTLVKLDKDINFFVTASAIGIYPTNTKKVLDENSKIGNSFLSLLCKDWEDALTENNKAKRKVYIRTGVVLDKSGGALQKMLVPFKLGLGGPIGDGYQIMSWIHLDDLVDIYYQAAINPQMEGAYNAVAPSAVDNFTFTKALGKALHRPTICPVPAIALKIALGEMSSVILDSLHVEPKRLVERNHQFHYETIHDCFKAIFQKDHISENRTMLDKTGSSPT